MRNQLSLMGWSWLLCHCGEQNMSCWMREGIHCWLLNLVEVRISDCEGCIHMCSFGRLPHLKCLWLRRLHKVEYIENDKTAVLAVEHRPYTPLFPSLEILHLIEMPQLKGWWSVTDSAQDQGQNKLSQSVPAFPKLDRVIMDMEVLISLAKTSFPGFSSLKYLVVVGKSKAKAEQTSLTSNVPAVQKQPLILLQSYLPKLRFLHLKGIETESLPEEFRGMSSLKTLYISECEALEGIPEWIDSLTSLQSLRIHECPGVKSLPQEISNLTNLEMLSLSRCSRELAERCKETTGEDSNVPAVQKQPLILLTSYLPKLRELRFLGIETESLPEEFRGMSSLIILGIHWCEALEGIPEWIDSLTSLETLYIYDCPGVKSLPQEISNLTNLKSLSLGGCSRELAERCKETTGEDWPKIQHIRGIQIRPAK